MTLNIPSHFSDNLWNFTCLTNSAVLSATAAKSLQLCPTLCDPIDGSPPGSPVPGILQARTLEWVAISFSNAWKGKVKVKWLSRARPQATPLSSSKKSRREKGKSESEVAQSCPTPSDPVDCSLPGSSFRGVFQARVPEWDAIVFSSNGLITLVRLSWFHVCYFFVFLTGLHFGNEFFILTLIDFQY